MSKRILVFSIAYFPYVGGAEVAIKEITDRVGGDFEFDLITLRFDKNLPQEEKIGNVNVHRIGFTADKPEMDDLVEMPLKLNKLLFPFLATLKAAQLHRKKKYDGTWAMMANYAGFAALFFKLLRPRVPFLLTLQEGDPIPYIKKKVRFVYPLFKQIFTRANSVQVISNYLGNFAREMGFAGEIKLVPNAVNTAHFSKKYSEEELNKLKQKLDKSENDKYVITTSRLVLKNAVDDVIKALEFLPPNVQFLVLGSGPDQGKLETLAQEKGLEKRVKFLGMIPHNELPKYLKISDIFIRPSLSEGFGNSFVEAMAVELPVIATPVGGIVDFLFDPDKNPDKVSTGLFCEVRDPKSIAEKIQKFLNEAELREQIIKNAKKMVFEKYDWKIIARDMQEIFKEPTK